MELTIPPIQIPKIYFGKPMSFKQKSIDSMLGAWQKYSGEQHFLTESIYNPYNFIGIGYKTVPADAGAFYYERRCRGQ